MNGFTNKEIISGLLSLLILSYAAISPSSSKVCVIYVANYATKPLPCGAICS